MRKILYSILILLTLLLLTGCSQKEKLYGPEISLHYTDSNNDQIIINNEDAININDLENIVIHLNAKWNYKIESFMSAPTLPKIELHKPQLGYFIYVDDRFVASNFPTNKFEEHEFKVETTFFKSTAEIGEESSANIKINEKGSYLVRLVLSIKVDDVEREYVSIIEFKLD